MARFRFIENEDYAARLVQCVQRPIENDPRSRLYLIRLEFGVYRPLSSTKTLRFTQSIASRDLIVGAGIDLTRDSAIVAYAEALRLAKPNDIESWRTLHQSARWVTIRFGARHPTDERNSFQSITARDITGWTVDQDGREAIAQWVGPTIAAKSLRVSEPTIRRRVDELASQGWGEELLIRTSGGQRRINLTLLRNLLDLR